MKNNVIRLRGFAKMLRPKMILEIVGLGATALLVVGYRYGFDLISFIAFFCALLFLYPLFSLMGMTRST